MSHSVFSNNLCRNRIVSLREVHECLDSTKTMRRTDRVDYFNSVGMDYVNVERYATVVERLNLNLATHSNYISNPITYSINKNAFADFIQYLEYIRFCIRFCISVCRD